MPRCGRPARRAVSRRARADEKNPVLSVDRKLFGTSTIGSHPARSAPAVAPHDPPRSADACRSAIGRPILRSQQQPEVAKSAKATDGFALGKQSECDQPDVAAAVRALERKLLPRPSPSAWPRQSATYRGRGAFGSRESRRSSLLWRSRRPYARASRPLAACRRSRWRAT
jgi:hypothetical protein